MGIFTKLGLVEEIPVEIGYEPEVECIAADEDISAAAVELGSLSTNTLIEDVYTQNDMYDMSRSIFKVDELLESLPKQMVTETKKETVISILGNFGLTATEVCVDGENRITVLNNVHKQISDECANSISQKQEQIEELKKSIAILESEISEAYEKQKISDETIGAEIEKILGLINFVGGAN